DHICFMSEAQRERFIGLLPSSQRAAAAQRTHVQPMGIDDPEPPALERAAMRRELGLQRFTLLTVARLVPVKGLVEAGAARALRAAEPQRWSALGPRIEALLGCNA